MTSAFAQINVQGPRSRELLQSLTSVDLSNEAFPFRTARSIDIGFARVLCVRITYVGELGYELYVPVEQATHVYDRLVAAGEPVGLRHAGLKALASLRMEKGYRDYGHDIDNTDSVLEAGLGFAVDLTKPSRSSGVTRCSRRRRPARCRAGCCRCSSTTRSRCCSTRSRSIATASRSATYAPPPTASRSVARSGWRWWTAASRSTNAWIDGAEWEVDIAGRLYPATASLRPLYDPQMLKVKA